MRFGKWLGVVLLGLGCGMAAHAQFGVYGVYSATQLSGISCLDPQGMCSSRGGKVNPSGLSGGIYYDFRTFGPVRLGFDLRGGEAHSNKSAVSSAGDKNATGIDNALAGVRGSFRTPISWLKPYAQISAGYARSDASEPFGTTIVSSSTLPPRRYDNFLQYEVFGGADLRIAPFLDVRVIELGIGNMNRIGSGSGESSVGVKSIGGGIVLHLP